IVTAKHITNGFDAGGFGVLPWKQLKIQLSNGDWVDIQMTQVKESKKFDLSIINLTKDLPSQFKPLQFAKETPELGESICGIG
ncbi:hypothetical protein ACPXAZ_25590, partial [Escherichia coli]|uniref:hypothetical protein n=1 Tax=Escherichia coli TaxID=562 RepID=UPI003CE5A027